MMICITHLHRVSCVWLFIYPSISNTIYKLLNSITQSSTQYFYRIHIEIINVTGTTTTIHEYVDILFIDMAINFIATTRSQNIVLIAACSLFCIMSQWWKNQPYDISRKPCSVKLILLRSASHYLPQEMQNLFIFVTNTIIHYS